MGARARLSLLGVICVLIVALGSCSGPAAAQTETSTTTGGTDPSTTTTRPPGAGSVFGTLVDRKGTDDTEDDEPIVGAKVTVTDAGGAGLGEDETGEDGRFEVPLPGEGRYRASLDPDTLPDGVAIPAGAATIEFSLNPGQKRILLFPLNDAARRTEGKLDLFLQAVADGIYFGLILAMASVGLSLIFGTTGLTNFAHGELVTLGALIALWLNNPSIAIAGQDVWSPDLPLMAAVPVATLSAALLGYLLDAAFWGPLRRRGTGTTAAMVISIGLSLALLNVYLYLFGGLTQPFRDFRAQPGLEFGTVSMPPKKLIAGAICLAILVAVATALQRTRMGKAMRAISDNPDLASSSGINVDGVIRLVWLFGAGLAGFGGIVFSISQDANIDQGNSMLLLLFAAVTLGGLGAAYGALVGGFVVGMLVNVSAVWIPTELKNVGALAVLIVVLLVRPQGILGRKERIG